MPVEHNPYDTPELVQIRKNEPDPIVMYLILKESLHMSPGKIGIQCGHAVQIFMLRYMELLDKTVRLGQIEQEYSERIATSEEWIRTSFRKVALRASDSEFERVKKELPCFLVRDAGLTEVPQGSETTLALWPMRKSERPKFIARLQVL